jgi:hypothetical protein
MRIGDCWILKLDAEMVWQQTVAVLKNDESFITILQTKSKESSGN